MERATAVKLLKNYLRRLDGWSYVIRSSREHTDCWAFSASHYKSQDPLKGKPGYGILGFSVDKVSGSVRQTMP